MLLTLLGFHSITKATIGYKSTERFTPAQIQTKRHPFLVAVVILALLPLFTLTSMSNSEAATTISTQAELEAITNLSGNYVLGADISLVNPRSGTNAMFVGDFTGTLDGAGHTITGLTGPLFVGIKGVTGTPAAVSHLNLQTIGAGFEGTGILADTLFQYSLVSDVHVKGKLIQQNKDKSVGGIAARAESNTSIENSSAVVTLVVNITDPGDSGNESVGGLIAETRGSILNSFAKAIITAVGRRHIGGLVGNAFQATIENSASSGSITGGAKDSNIGGLVGFSQGAAISNDYSSVAVSTNTDSIVGGLVGLGQNALSIHTEILNSYATGAVANTGENAGGLIGYIDQGSIFNCVATGNVAGLVHVGGLIGYAETSDIQYSRAEGNVIGKTEVGGLIGQVSVIDPGVQVGSRNVKYSAANGSVSSTGADAKNIGGLIGMATSDYMLSNISALGDVVAPNATMVGGLIGQTYSEVSQASAIGSVNSAGGDQVGGLVGFTESDLHHTSSSGAVTGLSNVGTLAGFSDANIFNSKSTGSSIVTGPTGANNQLVGNSSFNHSVTFPVLEPEGTTQSTGPQETDLELLNAPQDPLPWALSSRVNAFRPYIEALLGLGYYESTVTFDANGGSGTMAVQTNTGPADLRLNTFTRTGYTFDGWAESRNGPLRYRDERTYHFQNDQTLYAVWKAIIAISYNLGGGSGTLPTQTDVLEGDRFITAVSTGLSKPGYTFSKWNDGLVDTAANTSYTVSTSNVILTATWTANVIAPPVVAYIPPPPQPYLQINVAPVLHKVGDNAVCSNGSFNFGVNYFDGTPNTLIKDANIPTLVFKFFIDGVEQKALQISTSELKVSTPISSFATPGLLTCQVVAARGGVSLTATSTLNTAGVAEANFLKISQEEKANLAFQSAMSANTQAKSAALVANRALWRSNVALAQSNYAAIRSKTIEPASKSNSSDLKATAAVRVQATKEKVVAAKALSTAVASAAASYKQGIVLINADYLKKNSLAEAARIETQKNLNSAYANILEVNGYGVSLGQF